MLAVPRFVALLLALAFVGGSLSMGILALHSFFTPIPSFDQLQIVVGTVERMKLRSAPKRSDWIEMRILGIDTVFKSDFFSTYTARCIADAVRAGDNVQIWVDGEGYRRKRKSTVLWQISKKGTIVAPFSEALARRKVDKIAALLLAAMMLPSAAYIAFYAIQHNPL